MGEKYVFFSFPFCSCLLNSQVQMEWREANHSLRAAVLIDDVKLGGGLCVWLTKERREWLSGRWVDARWDVDELERRKSDIVERDLLKFRMTM